MVYLFNDERVNVRSCREWVLAQQEISFAVLDVRCKVHVKPCMRNAVQVGIRQSFGLIRNHVARIIVEFEMRKEEVHCGSQVDLIDTRLKGVVSSIVYCIRESANHTGISTGGHRDALA